jgi:hypothetical protein
MERLSAMPDWPARMTSDVACLFMCMAETTFLSRYGAHSFTEGGNRYWSTDHLRSLVAAQAGLPQLDPSPERDTSWDDLRCGT